MSPEIAPLPRGDAEAYAALVRQGFTLTAIGRLVARSREHVRQVLARGGYRTADLAPPPPARPPRPTSVCAACGTPIRYRPVGRTYKGGPRYCNAPACRRASARWHYVHDPAARQGAWRANRNYNWRTRHGTTLPPERDVARPPHVCAFCGGPAVKNYPWLAVRACNRPDWDCQRQRVTDRARRARKKAARERAP